MSDSGYVRGCADDRHVFGRDGICRLCGYWSQEWPIVTLDQNFVTKVTTDPTEDAPSVITTHYNRLTPGELERLSVMAEECAEVIQVIGKIMRHGYINDYRDNRPDLEMELGQVIYAYSMMIKNGDINEDHVTNAYVAKSRKIGKYLHHNDAVKVVPEPL